MNLPSEPFQGQNDPFSEPTVPAKHTVPGLIDSASLLNIIYDHVVKQHHLEPLVTTCQTMKVTLANSMSAMHSSRQIALEFKL